MTTKDQLLARLAPFQQQHVLAGWEKLTGEQQNHLADQIRALDLELVDQLFRAPEDEIDFAALARRAEPPPAIHLGERHSSFRPAEARARGQQALADGRIGAVLVAGGQGSRLGFDHPKGMFRIGPVSNASLFQILLEKIVAVGRRYGAAIPLYVMTSPATHTETRGYLEANNYFGIAAEDISFFCQGTMPAVDARTGELLMSEPGRLFESPDGHGGMLAAMDRAGALKDARQRGVEHLFYFQVDNPLATVCDEKFVGYHLLAESQYSLQVVAKRSPEEKVGNVVSVGGETRVIEYSDLPEDAADRRDANGALKIWAGSIAVHVFDVEFLCDMVARQSSSPFHRALKKVSYVDATGNVIQPQAPNALKFERFIFDLLPFAERTISVEVDPAEAFAPLKNASGAELDTPECVQSQIMNLHRRWLRAAGANVDEDVRIEISPLYALDAEQVAAKIDPGTNISDDVYLR